MLVAEIVLVISLTLQGFLLLLPGGTRVRNISEFIYFLGLLLAGVVVLQFSSLEAPMISNAVLVDAPLFRLPRSCMLFAAVLIGRIVSSTKEIPHIRKQEVLFVLTMLALVCDGLLLSRHLMLTLLLIMVAAWTGVFLGGLAHRGRLEGEAVLKFWLQISLALVVGLGSLVAITLAAGGLRYDAIAELARSFPEYSVQSLFLILSLCLPLILTVGLFPFHFSIVDRDQGVSWAVQSILAIIVQGAVVLALWKMGMEIFGHAKASSTTDGMRVLQYCGVAGGFVFVIFALSQKNARRLFAALLGANWSFILATGAVANPVSASAVSYAFSSVFLWGALLSFVWTRMQEAAGSELLSAVYGAGQRQRSSGLILLVALAGPLCVPGFPGFPAVLHLLGAVIEQQTIMLLLLTAVLLLLLCFVAAKLAADILFRKSDFYIPSGTSLAQYSKLDICALGLTISSMLLLGLFWSRIFIHLTESAKVFL